MKFRKQSTHASCATCDRLKTRIRTACPALLGPNKMPGSTCVRHTWLEVNNSLADIRQNLRDQIDAQVSYHHHLQIQWSDRRIYWGLRERAKLGPGSLHGQTCVKHLVGQHVLRVARPGFQGPAETSSAW